MTIRLPIKTVKIVTARELLIDRVEQFITKKKPVIMKKIALIQVVSFWIVLFGLCPPFANALSTGGRILNEISVSEGDQYLVIKIGFNFRVKYVRHYPPDYGKEVRIQLAPILENRGDQQGFQDRESLFPPANNPAGVIRVEFEGRGLIQPTLSVIFDQQTSFEVKQGSDFRSLLILVPSKKSAVTPEKEPTAAKEPPAKTSVAQPVAGTLAPERQESLVKEGVEVMASKNYPRAV